MKYINKPKLNGRFGVVVQALDDYWFEKNKVKNNDYRKLNGISWELYMQILKWIDIEVEKSKYDK